MSSHHFVREGQEPALLIMGHTTFSSVGELLEWAPTILVTEEMLEEVLSWGIRIDAVITSPGEALKTNEKLREVQSVDILSASGTPIEVAIEYLLHRRQVQVAVITDSFSGIRAVVEKLLARAEIVVLEETMRWIPVRQEFRKWTTKGDKYRVIVSEKAFFDIDGLRAESDFFVAKDDGMITIKSGGLIWLGEFYKT